MTSAGGIPPPGSPGGPSSNFFAYWIHQQEEEEEAAAAAEAEDVELMMRGQQLTMSSQPPVVSVAPPPASEFMIQAAVTLGARTSEGHLVEAVTIPWRAVIDHFKRNPSAMYTIDWRVWEEIIAAAYASSGYVVTLTPRSGDKGRDVIAEKPGLLTVKYFDQVKAYAPGHLVTREEVANMLGVLYSVPNVSKGIVTTTSDFAPGVYQDEELQKFMPHRLDIRNGTRLLEWLSDLPTAKP